MCIRDRVEHDIYLSIHKRHNAGGAKRFPVYDKEKSVNERYYRERQGQHQAGSCKQKNWKGQTEAKDKWNQIFRFIKQKILDKRGQDNYEAAYQYLRLDTDMIFKADVRYDVISCLEQASAIEIVVVWLVHLSPLDALTVVIAVMIIISNLMRMDANIKKSPKETPAQIFRMEHPWNLTRLRPYWRLM